MNFALKIIVLLCFTQPSITSQQCDRLSSKYVTKFDRFIQLQIEMSDIDAELKEIEKHSCFVETTPAMAKETKAVTVAETVEIETVSDLFNQMIFEANKNTDWAAERALIDQFDVSFASETAGSGYIAGLSPYSFRRFTRNLMVTHKMTDRQKLRTFTSSKKSNFMEMKFARTDGGIGWCRVGFVLIQETDTVNIAYNCVSFPFPEVENSKIGFAPSWIATTQSTFSEAELQQIAEILLKIRIHEAIGKFDRLYRRTMTK